MKSKTLYFNRGIFMGTVKRFGWISICYLLILTLLIPFEIVNLSNVDYVNKINFYNLFHLTQYELQIGIILIFPVLTAVLLFRYIHSRAASDMMHSLPIKRTTLYINQILIGILILILPIIITGVVCVVLRNSMDLSKYYSIRDVLDWVGYTTLYDMIFFSACVFFGVLVGMSVLQTLFTYIFLLLPVGLIVFVNYILSVLLVGYSENTVDGNVYILSPISLLAGNYRTRVTNTPIIVYCLLCALFLVGGLLLYRKRQVEAATEAIAFKPLQIVFKYGVTLCSMLVGGVYFCDMENRSIPWLIFGFVFGSVIGYFISEMLIKKSLGVFKAYKGYLVFLLVLGIALGAIKLDILGYQNRVPAISNISYVQTDYYNDGYSRNFGKDAFKTSTNIALLRNLHKQIISDGNSKSKRSSNIYFNYTLKNGRVLSRQYTIDRSHYSSYFKPLIESEEYKKIYEPAYTLADKDIDKITLNPQGNKSSYSTIVAPEDIKQFMIVLKQEILNKKYDTNASNIVPWGNISFLLKGKSTNNPTTSNLLPNDKTATYANGTFEKSYTKLEAWLKKKGYLNNSRIMPQDIKSVEIKKINDLYHSTLNTDIGTLFEKSTSPKQTITSSSEIDACLRNYEYMYMNTKSSYLLRFNYNNGAIEYYTISDNNLPAFIKK